MTDLDSPSAEPVDLWPTARQSKWPSLEHAVELVEAMGDRSFAPRDLYRHDRSPVRYTAAVYVIRRLYEHGLLIRSGEGTKSRYRIHPAHLPRIHAHADARP